MKKLGLRSLGLFVALICAASGPLVVNCAAPPDDGEEQSEDEVTGAGNPLGLRLTFDGDDHHVARAVEIGENDLRGMARDHLRIEDDARQAGEVGVFGGGGDGLHLCETLLQVRGNIDRTEFADFGHDGRIIGREHLSAVRETTLKTIVVERIMARRDNHPGVRPKMADGETQLRRRTRARKEVSLTAQFAPGARNQFGEVTRKVADIVGDDEAGTGLSGRDVAPEADDGAEYINIIKTRRADGRADREPFGIEFVGGRDPADRATPHPARPEGDAPVESILELGPGALGAEILQGGDGFGR